jgi:hypothetical protein
VVGEGHDKYYKSIVSKGLKMNAVDTATFEDWIRAYHNVIDCKDNSDYSYIEFVSIDNNPPVPVINGRLLGGVVSVHYDSSVDEVTTATITVHYRRAEDSGRGPSKSL